MKCGALARTPPEAAFEKAPLDSRKTFGARDLVGGYLWIAMRFVEIGSEKFFLFRFEKKAFFSDSGM